MKKNSYFIILICTIVFVIAEFSSLQIILKTTRLFPKTEIILQIEYDKIDGCEQSLNISNESITQLQNVIAETTLNSNQDKLLDAFDKERNFYINFITIISIVLSVIGITPVIYAFFEKNENAKVREELETLKKEYGLQLDKLEIKGLIDNISGLTDSLKNDYNLVFEDSTPVKDENDFYKFILSSFIKMMNNLKVDLLNEIHMQTFAIKISNFMLSIISYSAKRYGSSFKNNSETNTISIRDNEIFNNMFIHFQIILSDEQFKLFIDEMNNLPNKKFDYTGF